MSIKFVTHVIPGAVEIDDCDCRDAYICLREGATVETDSGSCVVKASVTESQVSFKVQGKYTLHDCGGKQVVPVILPFTNLTLKYDSDLLVNDTDSISESDISCVTVDSCAVKAAVETVAQNDIFISSVLPTQVNGQFLATLNDGMTFNIDLSSLLDDTVVTCSVALDAANVNELLLNGSDGSVQRLDLCPAVRECETTTVLALGGDNSSLDFTDEDGLVTNLNLGTIVSNLETVTSFSLAADGMGVIYVDENGSSNTVPLCPLVQGCETLTSLGVLGNNLQYTDENGTVTNIPFPTDILTSLVPGGDSQSLDYTDEMGVVTNIPLCPLVQACIPAETQTSLVAGADGESLVFTNESGVPSVIDVCPIVEGCETVTGLQYDASTGALTYMKEDGTQDVIILPLENFLTAASFDAASDVLTLTLTNGTQFQVNLSDLVDPNVLTSLVLNGTSLEYTDENGATGTIDLCPVVEACQTLTSLSLAGNSLTYVDENGNPTNLTLPNNVLTALGLSGTTLNYLDENGNTTNIDLAPVVSLAETVTTMALNLANQTVTYTNEAGDAVTFSIADTNSVSEVVPVVMGQTIATHDDGEGNVVNIQESISTYVLNGDGSVALTNEAGDVTTIPAPVVGNTSSVVEGPIGTFTHNDGAGNITVWTLPVSADPSEVTGTQAGNTIATHDNGDGNTVDINESITTFTVNVDGSIAYASENGTVTVSPASATLTDNGDGTATLVSNGNTVTLDICQMKQDGGCVPTVTQVGNTFTFDDGFGNTTNWTVGGGAAGGTISAVTGTIVGNTIASHDDNNGTVTDINETITELATDANCDQVYTDEAGNDTAAFKVLPQDINTQNNDLNGVYGSNEDGSECPTRVELPCGNILIGDDDGTIDKFIPFRLNNVADFLVVRDVDTAITAPDFTNGSFDTYVPVPADGIIANVGDIPAPPFVLPSCLKWIARVSYRVTVGLNNQSLTTPSDIEVSVQATPIVGGSQTDIDGSRVDLEVMSPRNDTTSDFWRVVLSNHGLFDINQAATTPITFLNRVVFSTGMSPRPNLTMTYTWGVGFEITRV